MMECLGLGFRIFPWGMSRQCGIVFTWFSVKFDVSI